ncbi:MAG: pre-peptidase C-terminal domain-containing protein, partial [Pirellula sp.]|nr:pre-peptidase C-terminal domain-containing protein [Pirellula sp.]
MQLPRVWLLLGFFLGCFAVCLVCDCKTLLSQIPITAMAPQALAPGKTTRVEWTASALKTPLRIGGSFPMEVQWIHIEPNKAVADVRIPETVRLGPTTLWLATEDSISEPLTILIDDLPSVSDNGANHSPSQPQAISVPCALDGRSDAAQSDFYQFRLNANATIGVDCVAERIGSAMDSVLRIWDTSGKLLLQSDDSDSGPDSQAQFTAPADGDYLIE